MKVLRSWSASWRFVATMGSSRSFVIHCHYVTKQNTSGPEAICGFGDPCGSCRGFVVMLMFVVDGIYLGLGVSSHHIVRSSVTGYQRLMGEVS